MSHPSRVRGLKQATIVNSLTIEVAPITGAWIETAATFAMTGKLASHPSRVRGLKLLLISHTVIFCESHPSRVRGLKHGLGYTKHGQDCRTHHGCVD